MEKNGTILIKRNEAGFRMEKGKCFDCKYFDHCPHLRGIDHCRNIHRVKVDFSMVPTPPADRKLG